MAERRFDDDESRLIFDLASQTSATPASGSKTHGSGTEGFTLAELQEIGQEAGIDPARIAQAARSLELRSAPQAVVRHIGGFPVGVSRAVELPTFDDQAWNQLVVDLRETFDATGHMRVDGDFREWRNGNLYAVVEPMDEGYRLRLSTRKGSAYRALQMGGAFLALALVLLVTLTLKGQLAEDWTGALFLALMGGGALGLTAVQLPSWARTRERQMEEVAERALLRAGEEASS